MSCPNSIYCTSMSTCRDTRCPGHPGQHCADLGNHAKQVNAEVDESLAALGWTVAAVLVFLGWLLLILVLALRQ